MEQFTLIAKTLHGLEEVLAKELETLGAQDIKQGIRMVSFTGDLEMMYKANFCLRTALRVLKPIKEFEAQDADDVYEAVKEMEWDQILDLKTSFAVDSVVYSEDFKHSKFVAYKVKDAIVDYFREKTGQRPNISVAKPDIKLNIHISGNACTLSLDSSGESLHKRGYRVATVESPINEVLAAGMLLMTGWQGECDLVDPMCGSGTIAVEAALIARNIYPGIFHTEKYAFENWKDFNPELLEKIYNDDDAERPFDHKIYARDIEPQAVNATLANARSAGVSDCIVAEVMPFQQFKQFPEKAIMVVNPPYGERVSSPNLLGLYRTIGEKLKHQFVGNDAWVISYRQETFDEIGLKPSLKIPLFNGSLDCEFRKYQIFDGKLKSFRSDGGEIKTDDERRKMREKKAIRPHSDFNQRSQEAADDDTDDIPAYLRIRHRSFVASQTPRHDSERHNRSENRRERDNDRDSFKSDRRSFDRSSGRGKGNGHKDFRKDKHNDNKGPKRHAGNRSPWARKSNKYNDYDND